MKNRIWVESEVGKGSSFVFVLPVRQTALINFLMTAALEEGAVKETGWLSTAAALQIEEKLTSDITLGRLFVTTPALLAGLKRGDKNEMSRHLKNLVVNYPLIERAFIASEEGVVLAAYTEDPLTIGKKFSDRDWYKGVSKNWTPYVSEFYLRAGSPQRYIFAIAIPMRLENEIKGILVMQPKADYLKDSMSGIEVGRGHIYAVDRKGRVIYHSEQAIDGIKDFSGVSVVQKVVKGNEGVEKTIDPDHKYPVISAYHPVKLWGWGLVVDKPVAVVFEPVRKITWLLFAITGFMLLLSGFLAYKASALLALVKMAEENLAVTLHSIGDGVLVVDVAQKVVRLNLVAEQLTGWKEAEARGRKVEEVFRIINEETRMPSVISIENVLATGLVKGLASHTVLIAKDGTERPIADSVAPIRHRGGEILGVVLVFRDVTAERKAERTLKRFNEELEQQVREQTGVLRTLNAELEQRVEERTRELENANQELQVINRELVMRKQEAEEAKAQAEAATRASEDIIETVREPLLALDLDLKVVKANHSFYDSFKVTPQETIGNRIYDLGNRQWNIPKLRELLETILPQKTTFDDYEVEHEFSTIGRRVMLLNARQIQRTSGKDRIILLAIEDITERKRQEDLLTESEERYRRIFETANDGILLLEKRKGIIIQTNLAAEKMLGYSKEECIGKNIQDIGVSLDMSDFPTLMQALDKNGIINYEDVTVKNKSGQYIDTDIYMVDRTRLVQCNIRDVTERKLEEEKLKKSEEFTRNILQSVDEGFTVIDLEYRVIAANRAYLNFIGKPLENVIGKHCYELTHHVDKPCCEDGTTVCPVTLTFKTGEHYSAIHSHYDNKGESIYLEVKSYPLKDKSGKVVSAIEISNDITERRRLEDQLRHAQKMEAVGTLAGGIAHDFNNILNVIMGYGGMVYDSLEAGSPSKEKMNEVLAAAERAANLTKRLLVFSRKQVVAVKPVNINELILGVQKMLVRMLREDIDFKLELASEPLIVLADTGQIEQVLMNLVTNARDVMPEGGSLTIGTGLQELDDEYVAVYGYGKSGRYALITVTDTGQGMNAETQKKIFEPFFTTKGIGEGTGLGLSISYGIIRQHSGYIKVYSEPGQGTIFKIYLPLSEEAVSLDKKTAAAVPTTIKGGNETILVAEDAVSVMQMTRITLESFGYSVIAATDGEDAINKFMENRKRISLALLDMIMPKKNGKEVSETIRKVNPRIKILFTSGYTMDIIKTKELTDAGFDFIGKPVLSRDLLLKVREVLDR